MRLAELVAQAVVAMVAVGTVARVALAVVVGERADNVPLGHSQNNRSHTSNEQSQNLARRLDRYH